MTREQHLAFCRNCKNRKFDNEQGLLCGLTDQLADFENECPDYILDPEATRVTTPQVENDGGVPSWVFYVGGLILINLLSYLFDWGFWLY